MTEETLNAFYSELEKIAYEHEQAYIEPAPGSADMRPPSLVESFDKKRDKDAVTSLLKSNRPGNIAATIAAGALAGGVLPSLQTIIGDVGYGFQGYLQGAYAPQVEEAALRAGLRAKMGKDFPNFTPKMARFMRTGKVNPAGTASLGRALGQKNPNVPFASGKFVEDIEDLGLDAIAKKRGLKSRDAARASLHKRYYVKDMRSRAARWKRPILLGGALGAAGAALYNRKRRKERKALLRRHRDALLDYEINRRALESL